jgi:hypothetical protein
VRAASPPRGGGLRPPTSLGHLTSSPAAEAPPPPDGGHCRASLDRAMCEPYGGAENAPMLFLSSLMIAVAAILLTQVAHRRAMRRSSTHGRESAYLLLAPVALVVLGLVLVAAVGASKALAALFFFAAFGLALAWTARFARA